MINLMDRYIEELYTYGVIHEDLLLNYNNTPAADSGNSSKFNDGKNSSIW